MTIATAPAFDFDLSPQLESPAPPEERGRGRDDVRLLVAYRSNLRIDQHRFTDLPDLLRTGDLLVVNRSATLPAALRGRAGGEPALLHISNQRDDRGWVIELRHADSASSSPWLDAKAGTRVSLPEGGSATLLRPATEPRSSPGEVRLWEAALSLPLPARTYLERHGSPIRYHHLDIDRPLSAYQTVFASEPGSAEMPSAARPFTDELVTRLLVRGIAIAPVVLHCGVSSMEAHETPPAERFVIPQETAERVNAVRRLGGRVVAVGTTVVRALESAAVSHGLVLPADGWTELVIGPDYPLRAVDALLTGWHEPRASHLLLLEAVAGRKLLEASYRSALDNLYLWHEFGDSHLILP